MKEVIFMAQTLVNFRIDETTKKQLEEICNELGLTLSTAFNIFMSSSLSFLFLCNKKPVLIFTIQTLS